MKIFKSPLTLPVLCFLLGISLYLPTLSYQFAYDDILHIQYNPLVTEGSPTLGSFIEIFKEPTPPGDLYRPLTTLTYKINHLVGGLNPSGYHLTNIILYGAICAVVFVLFKLFFQSTALPLAITLIFTVHPVHSEAVANIIGRAELLAAFFGISSLYISLRVREAQRQIVRYGGILFSASLVLLACLSKESALTFIFLTPLVMLAAPHDQNATLPKLSRLQLISFICCGILFFTLRTEALGSLFVPGKSVPPGTIENVLRELRFEERLLPTLMIFGKYLSLVITPVTLSADYSQTLTDLFNSLYSLRGVFSLLLLAGFISLLISSRRKSYGIWGLWFFGSFALTANIIFPIGTIMGERLLFTPSLGLIAFLCALLADRARNLNFRVLFPLYLLFLTYQTIARTPVWQSNETLFTQTVIDAPSSPKALYNLGVHLKVTKNDRDGAENAFRAALDLFPNFILPMRALADIALEKNEFGRAEYWCRKILEIDPHDTRVREQLDKLLKYKLHSQPPQ